MKNDTEEKEMQILEATSMLEKGSIEAAEGYCSDALEYYHEALMYYEKLGFTKGVVEAYLKKGSIYMGNGKVDTALNDYN